ncbi:MAG: hypothetical protein RBU45_16135 [Myxococcota bacterium]|jgi:hypothetical protein|nr:hypothetical protein [Myxococcota bacterium]
MAKRPVQPLTDELVHAARLSRLPGVTLAETVARTGVRLADLKRARQELGSAARPGRIGLLLSAITDTGRETAGEIPALSLLASWLDYTNKDGSTPEQVGELLAELAAQGVLALEGSRYRLLVRWP